MYVNNVPICLEKKKRNSPYQSPPTPASILFGIIIHFIPFK